MEHFIPIELLRTLLLLHDNKSFSKTAEILGRSQSTISLQSNGLPAKGARRAAQRQPCMPAPGSTATSLLASQRAHR